MNWLRAGTAMLRVVQSGIVSLVDRTQTVTGLWTYDRGTSAPFAVENTSAAVVTNLDADKLDGQHASAFATSGHIHANAVDVSGTPTAGRTVEWTDANTIEDAGFATSDIARLSQAQTFAESQTVETSGVDGWILQKTGLAHGITNKAPTDVHGAFESYSVNGGAYLLGITKSASEAGFFFDGATTQSTVSTPVILMYAGKKSGASTTALTGTEPIWHLINGGSTVALSLLGNGNFGIGAVPTAPLDVNGNRMRIRTSKTPSSASDTGNAGEICWDSSYIYVCTATDTWKRVAIATW